MEKRPSRLYTILIGGILCALFSYFLSQRNNYTTEELVKEAEIKLHQKEEIAKSNLDKLSELIKNQNANDLFSKFDEITKDLSKSTDISLYAYRHDSLCFWTDNQPAVDLFAYSNETDVQLIKIRNGWYEFIKQKNNVSGDYTLIALIAVKPEYDFENRYLNNTRTSYYEVPCFQWHK